MKFEARSNRSRSLHDRASKHYVAVSFRAPLANSAASRNSINVSMVLDRSGSMGGEKIVTARHAVDMSIRMLRSEDRFSVVVFDNMVDIVTPSTLATPGATLEALRDLARIHARGGTDLGGGWTQGVGELLRHQIAGGVNRLMLTTDGQANAGVTDPTDLFAMAAEARARGVSTSTFGIGRDFNETLLQGMADKGGGNFYFIEDPAQLPDVLTSELGESLEVTVREPVVEVMTPAGVTVRLLNEFPVTRLEGGLGVQLNDLTSGQMVDLLFEVMLPGGDDGASVTLGFVLRGGAEREAVGTTDVRWMYANAAQVAASPRDHEVEKLAAEAVSAGARAKALKLNRDGHYEEARALIHAIVDELAELAIDNDLVRGIGDELLGRSEMFASEMSLLELKRQHFNAYAALKGRTPRGRARGRGLDG